MWSREAEGSFFRGRAREGTVDTLGLARRAGGVVHHVADGPILGWRRGLGVGEQLVGVEADDLADSEARGAAQAGFFGGIECDLLEALVSHEDLRLGVLQDVADLGTDEVVVVRDQVPPSLQAGEVELDHLLAVGQQGCHDVPRLEPESTQRVDHLVGTSQELACGHLSSIWGDQGQVLRILARDRPEAEIRHQNPPWRPHASVRKSITSVLAR